MNNFSDFLRARRDIFSSWFLALSAGSYVGGVMFNVLGAGNNPQNATIGGGLVVTFLILAVLSKGGKNG